MLWDTKCVTPSLERKDYLCEAGCEKQRGTVFCFFSKKKEKKKKKANEGKTLRGMLVSPGSVLGF